MSLIKSLPFQIFLALVFGTALGLILGPKAQSFGEVGLFLVKVLKTLAIPLIFFAIVDAFFKTEIAPKQGLKLLMFSTLNASVALLISVGISRVFPVGKYLDIEKLAHALGPSVPEKLKASPPGLTASSFFSSFIPPNILGVILCAVLLGVLLRFLKRRKMFDAGLKALESFFSICFSYTSKLLKIIIKVVPIAVVGIIAKVVGQTGLGVFSALIIFVLLVTTGLFVHVFIYYSLLIIFVLKKSPIKFYKDSAEPLMTAFGTGSSLAALPVTLPTLQEKMGVSEGSARLAACVGTNLNHDGILLYEAVAAYFVAQIQGVSLSLNQQITLSLTSVLAAVGIAGIPDAGLITLSLVLGAVGLPLTAVPFLLPVDWFIGRLRATTNVASNMVVAHLLDRK